MLRTTLAALAVTAMLASASFAGDCATCGYGSGSGGYAAASWDGYCGCGGNGCNSCGGRCKRCCFPLIHCTLHKVGRVFDALLPDPCCRRSCGGAVGCAQPACGLEPGCGAVGMPADPFLDDHHSTPPTPTPAADARARNWSNAKMMSYPKPLSAPALKPMPMKSSSKGKPTVKTASKSSGKSVLKVAYDEDPESGSSDESDDAPPAAPASIRRSEPEIEQVRFTTPVGRVRTAELPANPLRP